MWDICSISFFFFSFSFIFSSHLISSRFIAWIQDSQQVQNHKIHKFQITMHLTIIHIQITISIHLTRIATTHLTNQKHAHHLQRWRHRASQLWRCLGPRPWPAPSPASQRHAARLAGCALHHLNSGRTREPAALEPSRAPTSGLCTRPPPPPRSEREEEGVRDEDRKS
jgi:hypothetical protein